MNEEKLNTHFVLVIIAVLVSCFTGFWTIPLALAALVFSLRANDLVYAQRVEEAKKAAWWAGLFGWLTVIIAIIPLVLIILFGGTILALLGAALTSA